VANASPGSRAHDSRELWTVPEVADFLRVSRKGVYSLVETRKIPFVRISNRIRFFRSDVLAWLEENRVPASEKSR
jgi:excisionase family DNA binding protein